MIYKYKSIFIFIIFIIIFNILSIISIKEKNYKSATSQDVSLETPVVDVYKKLDQMNRSDKVSRSRASNEIKIVSSSQLSDSELISVLKEAGFTGENLREAWAIAKRESGGRPSAFNGNFNTGDKSYGLFQINMIGDMGPSRRDKFNLSTNEDLFNPVKNAKVAYQMSKGGSDWGAWGLGPNAYTKESRHVNGFKKWYNQYPG